MLKQAAIFVRRDFRDCCEEGELDDFVSFSEIDSRSCPYEVVVSHRFPNFVDNTTKEEKIVQRVNIC